MTDSNAITLPEYEGNPFISRLPQLASQKDLRLALEVIPHLDPRERSYPAHVKKHCIARLARCCLPQARQVELAERFGILLRQGYVGRNPLTQDYLHHLHNGLDRIQAGSLDAAVGQAVQNTASSFALLGCPGVGKTLAMNRVLSLYPQTIRHDDPFSLVQVVWLRLEAPALGSLKQLCIDFFEAIDKLLGTDYVKRYATGVTVEQMLPNMAHVAHLHALGALIIDEIQHLRGAKVGADALMKFLVKLVNTIGVPVIPIGTMGALPILQVSFSQARRSSGVGSLLWDRMAPDGTWDHFLKKLWTYQWTDPMTELTSELSAVIYDECQGVADLAVKLFLLAQLRIVGASEVRKNQSELLTEALFRRVAHEELAMVRPMIEALRNKDQEKINEFGDLQSLNDYVTLILDKALSGSAPSMEPAAVPASPATSLEMSLDSILMSALSGLGVAQDVSGSLVREAIVKNPSGDPLLLMQQIVSTLAVKPPERKPPKIKPQRVADMPASDLRRLVREGAEAGKSGYDVLLGAGVVRPPLLDFAA